MTTHERTTYVTEVARPDARRLAGIPWWAIVFTLVTVLLLMAIWNTPVWADSGGNVVLDEVPMWIITLLALGALAGVQGLVASHKR